MSSLDGKVAVITGAAHGLGRGHALYLAQQGARIVVNDLGADVSGSGADESAAQQVVDEIRDAGGEAVAHYGDAADFGRIAGTYFHFQELMTRQGSIQFIDQAVGDAFITGGNDGLQLVSVLPQKFFLTFSEFHGNEVLG